MQTPTGLRRMTAFKSMAQNGAPSDIDALMTALSDRGDIATSRLVDFALSLVEQPAGVARLQHYLLRGDQKQRNYAALYFKRRGRSDLLMEAVNLGLIDAFQAFSS